MRNKRTYWTVFCILIFIGGSNCYGQKQLDSLLEATGNKIFDNPNEAILIANQVLEEATEAETKISAYRLISNAYLSKRDNSKSLEYALKMRDYIDDIKNVKTKMKILNTIGMQHQQLRIYDKAIEYLDEALLVSKKIPADSIASLLAYNYAIKGFVYREQMSCEIALNYFDRAIDQFKKADKNNLMTANLSTLNYNKGNCFLQLSQIDSARATFKKAIDYAETVNAKSLYAFAKKGMSEVLTSEGNYQGAIQELKEAETASASVGDLILNQGIYGNLSNNYLALNDRELYKKYFEKSNEIQKQINKKEEKSINDSLDNLIKETQIETQENLLKLHNIFWVSTLIILAFLLYFIISIRKNYNRYKMAKRKLESLRS